MPAPSVESVDNLWLGILLDPQQATVVHDLGPYGGSAEVKVIVVSIISLHCRHCYLIRLVQKFILEKNIFTSQ